MKADALGALILLVLLSSGCSSRDERKALPPQKGSSATVAPPRSSGVSAKPSLETAPGPVETFSGYVEVGKDFTTFEPCGSETKNYFGMVNGDPADKVVRQRLLELGRTEGVFLGSGAGRVVSYQRGVQGLFKTVGTIEFTSFSLADRCQGGASAAAGRPKWSVESAKPLLEQAPGPVETFFGYVEVGEEFTVFEPCGSRTEKYFALVHGDAASKIARRTVAEQRRMDGVVIGSGEGRVVSHRSKIQGPIRTKATIEFVSFSLADRCP